MKVNLYTEYSFIIRASKILYIYIINNKNIKTHEQLLLKTNKYLIYLQIQYSYIDIIFNNHK